MLFDITTFDFSKVIGHYDGMPINGLQLQDDLKNLFGVMNGEDRFTVVRILEDLGLIVTWGTSSYSGYSGHTAPVQRPAGPRLWNRSKLSIKGAKRD